MLANTPPEKSRNFEIGGKWDVLEKRMSLGAAVFFHNYWGVPADQQMVQKLMFTKNLGIAGGLLAMAALGGGALGLDGRRRG